jgi:hypothetical protein
MDALIKNRAPDETTEGTMKIKEGFSYVYKTKIILYSISLDMFSVVWRSSNIACISPKISCVAEGLGIMRAAPSIRAVLALFVLSKYSPWRTWRNLMGCYRLCIATLVFAVSENFILSIAALFATGADSVGLLFVLHCFSFLCLIMRGRVNAINGIFLHLK